MVAKNAGAVARHSFASLLIAELRNPAKVARGKNERVRVLIVADEFRIGESDSARLVHTPVRWRGLRAEEAPRSGG